MEKQVKLFYVTYDEASLRKKGKSARGFIHDDTELDCVEYLQCATAGLSISPDTRSTELAVHLLLKLFE